MKAIHDVAVFAHYDFFLFWIARINNWGDIKVETLKFKSSTSWNLAATKSNSSIWWSEVYARAYKILSNIASWSIL